MGNQVHHHPQDDKETVRGRLLEDKEDLEESDMSPDPITKKWEKIPTVHIGARLPMGHKTMFVRPVDPNQVSLQPGLIFEMDSFEAW